MVICQNVCDEGVKINITEGQELVAGLQKASEAGGKVGWTVLIQEL